MHVVFPDKPFQLKFQSVLLCIRHYFAMHDVINSCPTSTVQTVRFLKGCIITAAVHPQLIASKIPHSTEVCTCGDTIVVCSIRCNGLFP